MTGTENYVTSYIYDEANRLQSETRSGGDSSNTLYTYDADGNLLTYIVTKAGGTASGAFQYDAFGQLLQFSAGGTWTAYAYNAQGIRTEKTTADGWTQYLLDGKNVVGEQTRAVLVTYLRGANLISRRSGEELNYYLFDAHGDVTELIDSAGTVTHSYRYNAFGEEKDPDPEDTNPFRYCGEYYDAETGTYYLRARHYDPQNGRFTQQDTHWNTANSIYGDNPQRINEREDGLGLKAYTYVPQISAIMQSGNLYVYCVNNPVLYQDEDGEGVILAGVVIGAAVGATIGGISAAIVSNSQLGYVDGTWVLVGVGSGIAIGGLAGWALAGTKAAASISWAFYKATTTIGSTAYAIGHAFEDWFYNAYNVMNQQVRYAGCRFDAIYQNSIIELKNYNWSSYSSYYSLAKRFTDQANNYIRFIGETIAGQKIQSVQFVFSSKPPEVIVKALEKAGVIVKWISEG